MLPIGTTTWDDGQGPLTVALELLYTGLIQVCPLHRENTRE